MRTTARETAFKLIFSSQFQGTDEEELKSSLYKSEKLSSDDIIYCDKVMSLVKANNEEFVTIIDKHSSAFPEKRLFPADRAILFVALSEILYFDDIPDKVSLSEAANIASKYSSEKSASYITGILSSVVGEKNV